MPEGIGGPGSKLPSKLLKPRKGRPRPKQKPKPGKTRLELKGWSLSVTELGSQPLSGNLPLLRLLPYGALWGLRLTGQHSFKDGVLRCIFSSSCDDDGSA